MTNIKFQIVRSVLAAYPFPIGHGRIAQLGIIAQALPLEREFQTKLASGEIIFVDARDHLHRIIAFFGFQDKKIAKLLPSLLRPGNCFVDVGANCGAMSLACASLVGPSGRVVAFEPNPKQAALFEKSIKANGFTKINGFNIEVKQIGLSNTSGRAEMIIPESCSGYGAIVEGRTVSSNDELIEIEVCSSGEAMVASELTQIDLLKVDIEGHEEPFFEGAKNFISTYPPVHILCELSGEEPFWDRASIKYLSKMGYEFYGIPHGMNYSLLMKLDFGSHVTFESTRDFIATRNSQICDALC